MNHSRLDLSVSCLSEPHATSCTVSLLPRHALHFEFHFWGGLPQVASPLFLLHTTATAESQQKAKPAPLRRLRLRQGLPCAAAGRTPDLPERLQDSLHEENRALLSPARFFSCDRNSALRSSSHQVADMPYEYRSLLQCLQPLLQLFGQRRGKLSLVDVTGHASEQKPKPSRGSRDCISGPEPHTLVSGKISRRKAKVHRICKAKRLQRNRIPIGALSPGELHSMQTVHANDTFKKSANFRPPTRQRPQAQGPHRSETQPGYASECTLRSALADWLSLALWHPAEDGPEPRLRRSYAELR